MPGGATTGAIGEPQLPTFSRFVLIPDRAGVRVESTILEEDEYDAMRVAPAQREHSTGRTAAGLSAVNHRLRKTFLGESQ